MIRIRRKVQEDRTDAVARGSGNEHDRFGYFSFPTGLTERRDAGAASEIS